MWTPCKDTHLSLTEGEITEYWKRGKVVPGGSASQILVEPALRSLGMLVKRDDSWASIPHSPQRHESMTQNLTPSLPPATPLPQAQGLLFRDDRVTVGVYGTVIKSLGLHIPIRL